ncbi:MAG: hypothetical protein KatS3mg031_2534 [Chitinophagales bacterium]|nr:MAG: hypothetical protein KatS3mg031_2534 [Chitinophagales bacterium]
MSIPQLPADFLEKWSLYAHHFNQINGNAVAIGIGSIAITVAFNHLFPKIPGSLIAILLTTLAVHFLHLPVNTIEAAFGKIPNHLPAPTLPHVDFDSIRALIQPAFAIALLGAIESLLSAVVADGMIGGRHRSNTELIAQGIANISSALFGGIPATGAIARTATNVKNGGRTPIAGITHALTLLLIMLLLAPLAGLIPLACLAGILTVVAYHMSEWRQFVSLLRGNKYDVILLLVTFFLTIFFDLVIAIEIGIVLASFALMRRLSESVSIQNASVLFNNESDNGEQLFDEELPKLPAGVIVYEIRGPLFFGAAQTFRETLAIIDSKPRVIIFRMRHVPFIDATGIYRLKEVIRQLHAQRIHVVLSGVNAQVKEELEKGGLYSVLQREFLLDNITAALHKAQALLHASWCKKGNIMMRMPS